MTGLLEANAPGAVARLSQLWPAIGGDRNKRFVLSALADSFRDTTPASIQQLGALLDATSTTPDLRGAAINALAAIHTRATLPFLAALLASSDSSEQMKAVIGLSSFANGCASQTPANVKTLTYAMIPQSAPYQTKDTVANFAFQSVPPEREAQLVAFWTAWWAAHPELH